MKPSPSLERRRSGRGGREGYISLLAVTFAFGLATLGTVMVISFRSYASAAVEQERAILDRISLDSASAQVLGQLADGAEQPIAPYAAPAIAINGRAVAVEVSLPEGKQDLAMDGAKALAGDLDKQHLPNGLGDLARDGGRGLAEISRLSGLTASAEDCLRRRYTLGRAPEGLEPLATTGSQSKLTRRVMSGDQVDLRLSIRRERRVEVLWQRARFTGVGPLWKFHDDRRLTLEAAGVC